MTVRKLVVVQPAVLTVVLMMVCHMEAANLQLVWDPSLSPVAGYKVYYGLSSGDYDTIVDVGNQTSYSLLGLESDQPYYFTITAYDSLGNESPFANEVSGIAARSSSSSQGPVAAYTFDEESGSMVYNASGEGDHGAVVGATRASQGRFGSALSFDGINDKESQPGTSYHPAPSDPPDAESSPRSASQQLVSEWVEVGEAEVDQHWKRVELRKSFVDPIVVAKALSHQEPEPVAVQLRDIDDSGFEIRLQPRNERTHAPATVGYLVMERGSYRLADGTLLEGGIVEAGTTDDLTRIAFGQRFSARPVVMAAIVSGHEAKVVSGRPTMISNGGFRYRLETSSHHTSMDMPVSLAYVAWEPSWGTIDGLTFEVKRVSHVPYDLSHTIWFEEIFEATPVFLADVQGPADRGILGVRWEGKNFEGVMISIDPPPPPSPGTTQMPPVIGYIAIEEASRN
jgi:Fibronectin type III domain